MVRAAVDHGENNWRDVRGDCGGKCLWRKYRQPWKQGNTTEPHIESGAITIASLAQHASIDS